MPMPLDLSSLSVGFDIPAKPGMALADVQTPCLAVDLDALEHNIRRMGDLAAAHGVSLRPHAKTHKSVDIALLQQDIGGAHGICCQKVSEAEVFARGGIRDILISNEVRDPVKIEHLAQLPKLGTRILCCVDDLDNIAPLADAATRHGTEIECLVEIDCGAGRCGVTEPSEAVAIARAVNRSDALRFAGLQAYQGALQHIALEAERRDGFDAAVARARAVATALRDAGVPCQTITGGGTGSWPLEAASGLFTELQCGSYIFMDADYGRVLDHEGKRLDRGQWKNALFLITSVMSHAKPDRAVCDAGLKSLSVDSGPPVVFARDDVAYTACSDEHGTLDDPGGVLRINEKLALVPGHCDPTCNLHDWYVGLRGDKVERLWPVSARGKSF